MKNMNQDLKDNPKWAALYLQDMMDIIQHWADEDSLRQVVCYAKAYLRDMTEEEDDNKLTDDKKQFLSIFLGIQSCAPLWTLSNFVMM